MKYTKNIVLKNGGECLLKSAAEEDAQGVLDIFLEKEVYLCAVVDNRIVGTAGVDAVGGNKVKHRAEFGIAIDKKFWGMGFVEYGRNLRGMRSRCSGWQEMILMRLELV